MTFIVVGQRGNEPTRVREVTPYEFYWAWGPYAKWLLENARFQTAYIGEYKMRVVVVQ